MLFRPLSLRVAPAVLLFLGSAGAVTETLAQQPSQAQVNAIRQSCRSDYMAHCASVPAGGAAALDCLRQHASSLSAACQQAVNAIQAPATAAKGKGKAAPPTGEAAAPSAAPTVQAPAVAPPAADSAAAPAAPKAAPASKKAQLAKLGQACGTDYRLHCHGIPLRGPAALACLTRNAPTLSPGCREVLATVATSAPAAKRPPVAAPAAPTVVAAPAAPSTPVQPAPLLVSPREELLLMRTACGADYARFCRGLRFGAGRVATCLHYNMASLSPRCQQAMTALHEGR
ncbi:MAG: hypothetical protein IT538_03710 [Variibacter sp.]|nr:hypothetical protein [Variibacter sp.]